MKTPQFGVLYKNLTLTRQRPELWKIKSVNNHTEKTSLGRNRLLFNCVFGLAKTRGRINRSKKKRKGFRSS